ncbi:clostripain-related cysteine peptidase [Myxococcota bacterium]
MVRIDGIRHGPRWEDWNPEDDPINANLDFFVPSPDTPKAIIESPRASDLMQPSLLGNIHVRNRRDLERLANVRSVDGDVWFESSEFTEDDLRALKLERITGRLGIYELDTISLPLPHLKAVDGWVDIRNCPNLRSLSEFGLRRAQHLTIANCQNLDRIDLQLTYVEILQLVRLHRLQSLNGLRPPRRVPGSISLHQNPKLTDVSALRSVVSTPALFVEDNRSLSDPRGLDHLAVRTNEAGDLDTVIFRRNGFSMTTLAQLLNKLKENSNSIPPVTVSPIAGTTPAIGRPAVPPAEWTFFVYMNADNDLEAMGVDDLQEMRKVGSLPGQVNILVLVDGHGGFVFPSSSWSPRARLLYIAPRRNSELAEVVELPVASNSELGRLLDQSGGELNMGDPAVLRAAVRYIRENYPSDRFALDAWNHAKAWEHAGVDFTNGDTLEVAGGELLSALDGLQIDVLGFDSCMAATYQTADIADRLGVKCLVASEELEPGTGWPYDRIFSKLPSGSFGAHTLAQVMVDAYSKGGGDNATLSATRMDGWPAVRKAFDSFMFQLLKRGGRSDPVIEQIYRESLRFGRERTQMDLGDFARRILARYETGRLAEAAHALLYDVTGTCYAKTAMTGGHYEHAEGMAIYAPVHDIDSSGANNLPSRWRAFLYQNPALVTEPSTRPPADTSQLLGASLSTTPPSSYATFYNVAGNMRYSIARDLQGRPFLQIRGQIDSYPWSIYPEWKKDSQSRTTQVRISFFREDDGPPVDGRRFVEIDAPLPALQGGAPWRIQVHGRGGNKIEELAVTAR